MDDRETCLMLLEESNGGFECCDGSVWLWGRGKPVQNEVGNQSNLDSATDEVTWEMGETVRGVDETTCHSGG